MPVGHTHGGPSFRTTAYRGFAARPQHRRTQRQLTNSTGPAFGDPGYGGGYVAMVCLWEGGGGSGGILRGWVCVTISPTWFAGVLMSLAVHDTADFLFPTFLLFSCSPIFLFFHLLPLPCRWLGN